MATGAGMTVEQEPASRTGAQTVLVVEDEASLSSALSYNLRKNGFNVLQAADGIEGLQAARSARPDVIVLDLMLPRMDGMDVCRRLRAESDVPIIMLTAKSEEMDRVVGLEIGADDYLTKPFSMRELMARVKALLRRVRLVREEMANEERSEDGDGRAGERLVFPELTIDLGRREMYYKQQPFHLKPKEFELLVFLARNRGIVLSRDLILERVWGWDYDGGSRTVDVHVRWLREKIEEDPSNPTRIVTVRGIGYRFEG